MKDDFGVFSFDSGGCVSEAELVFFSLMFFMGRALWALGPAGLPL